LSGLPTGGANHIEKTVPLGRTLFQMLLQCWRESEKEDEIKMILLLLLTGKKSAVFSG
jgi:hypothetical protein